MKKKRIVIAALTGTIAISALSISLSLAWYAGASRVSISTIDVNINTDHNLYIATEKDGNYTSNIAIDDENAFSFYPVSSMYNSEWVAEKSASIPLFYDCSDSNVPWDGELKQQIGLLSDSEQTYYPGLFSKSFWLKSDVDRYVTLAFEDEVQIGKDPANKLEVTPSSFKADEVANRQTAKKLTENHDFLIQYAASYLEEEGQKDRDALIASIIARVGQAEWDSYTTFKKENEIQKEFISEFVDGYVADNNNVKLLEDRIFANLQNLYQALRISILVNNPNYYRYYIINPSKEDENDVTYYGGRLDNNGDGYWDTYMPLFGTTPREVVYGQVLNRDEINDLDNGFYNEAVGGSAEEAYMPDVHPMLRNSFNAVRGSKNSAMALKEEKMPDIEYAVEPSYSLKDLQGDDTELLIPCYRDEPTEIVVSIYLEGWDKDCINATMGAKFNSTLSFKLLKGI